MDNAPIDVIILLVFYSILIFVIVALLEDNSNNSHFDLDDKYTSIVHVRNYKTPSQNMTKNKYWLRSQRYWLRNVNA